MSERRGEPAPTEGAQAPASGGRLSGLDASFLHLERGPAHMHVGSTMVFEGPAPSHSQLCEHLASRLSLVPRFRQRLRFVPLNQGRPKWVDDSHFNLDYHVRHTALPEPGASRQLQTLAARIFSQRLDRSKPLWEMWLVEGLSGGRFAIVAKSHHCLVDGISGIDVTTVLFDLEREPAVLVAPADWVPGPEPSDAELLVEAMVERATSPTELVRGARALLRAPRRAARAALDRLEAAGALAQAGIAAPPSPLNVGIGPYRRVAWARVPLAELRRIKSAAGATVNDVILAAVSLALGRFLRARGHATANLELRAMVPISVRAAADRGGLGNRLASLIAPLPVWCSDPLETLDRVSRAVGELKRSKQAAGARMLAELADFAPPTILGQAARLQSRQRFFNLVVTNVPGPQVPLYLVGRELLEVYPMVPLARRQAVCVGVMSYNGQVHFGLVGDYDAMAAIGELAGDIERAVAALAEAVAQASPSVESTAAETRSSFGSAAVSRFLA